MGTRSAIAIVIDGKIKATYNHYDGYPTGVGADLQKELRGIDLWALKPLASALRWVNSQDNPSEDDIKRYPGAADPDVSTGRDWYSLLRDHHGSILKRLEAGVATDDSNFLEDSLFCEWAYLFNFDTQEVEILEGFNKDEAKQHPLCAFKREDWEPGYEGEKFEYWGCSPKWKGTLAEFLALDMEMIEE